MNAFVTRQSHDCIAASQYIEQLLHEEGFTNRHVIYHLQTQVVNKIEYGMEYKAALKEVLSGVGIEVQ